LAERYVRNVEVGGSNPLTSTTCSLLPINGSRSVVIVLISGRITTLEAHLM
jgi:hypothetical protein